MAEAPLRERLLAESSARALSALRERSASSLTRVRVLACAVFCILAAVLGMLHRDEWSVSFWPLLAYCVVSWAAWRGVRGDFGRVAEWTPLADVLFVFALQWEALPLDDVPLFAAAWTVSLFALVIGLSALTLRARVVAATAAASMIAVTLLDARAHVGWDGTAGSAIVLALIALVGIAVIRELDGMLAQLIAGEAEHEELRRAQSEAETLTQLLVHDMKGPLTGLIGLAEVVASEVTGRLHADLKMIEEQGRRLQRMVGDLLDIARLERGTLSSAPESVDLSALVTATANAYRARGLKVGAVIEAQAELGLCATVHREMVQRLYDNLVLNALDFVSEGGRIEVSAARRAGELVLAVRNTGKPIPPDVRARLFLKARSTRGENHLGLGLYFCRLVALAHDGAIALEDEQGWAASFVARLPVEATVHPLPISA